MPQTECLELSPPEAWQLLRQHSRSTLSAQAMGPGYRYLRTPEALVAFVEAGGSWVAAGPPVVLASRGDVTAAALGQAARAFVGHAGVHRRRCVFFGIEPAQAVAMGCTFVPLGDEMVLQPQPWLRVSRKERGLASQLRRAKKRGITVSCVPEIQAAPGTPLHHTISQLSRVWQAQHAMPAMQFVVALRPLRRGVGQKLYVAQCAASVVAFAVVLPVGSSQCAGWLIEHIVRHPRAPNGTAELLINSILEDLPQAHEVSLGLVPLSGSLPRPLRAARALGGLFYNFSGLLTFKRKLRPQLQRPLGLAYPGSPTGLGHLAALWALLRAFAGGTLTGFVMRLLARGPLPVLMAMAAVLPLWMYGLSRLPTDLWFVAPWVQQAWLLFDGGLFFALCFMLRAPTVGSLWALALVVSLDAAVTLLEALIYPGPKHLFGLVLHAVGVGAPTASAVMLWGAYLRALCIARSDAQT